MRQRWAGIQMKPDSRKTTRNPGQASNTPSTIMLVSWVANTCAIAVYSSRKNDGQPVGVGGMTGAPPK